MNQRVAANLAWMLFERGLQVGIGIVVVAMLARALGPVGFAHFQYAQSMVLIAASFALVCGAEVVVPRLVAADGPHPEAARHALLAHAFVLRFAGGVIGYLLMLGYLGVTSPDTEIWHAALLLGIAILLREPFGVVSAWMQARTHNRPGVLFNMAALGTKAALVGALFLWGVREVSGYAAAFAIEAVVVAGMQILYFRLRMREHHVGGLLSVDWRRSRLYELFASGGLFWGSFVLMMGARRVDQLVLQPAVPAADFGAYAACMQILDNFTVLASVLAAGLAPAYVYARGNLAEARANTGRVALALTALGLLGGAAIAACAPWIVHLLYGQAFASTIALLRAAALLSALVFADVGLTLLAVHLRRPDWIAIKWLAVFVVTLLLDLAIVPHYGSWGAIAGYGLGNAVAALVGVTLWWRCRQTARVAAL
ncbi:lipopolysaccharide biosynthesis protein [Cupriavidus plantarum]|uniref:lipopolysaccharide biosynthesis protein n=1 Tax=Cupriavidus plantarum TaxID=942865 RepID=UPI000EB30B0D|nr:oligosaccharide flippase family protein [Cupriavidus plantarum]NYH98077.1 O-antigen/teichoic acid export membrane protein [Cupriavidus plantarum]RLK35492.1 O-antigen/teichoic acid export membrane protein [Cupriavidus plantarum]